MKAVKSPPNIIDVARRAGVSKSTTARVLAGVGAASPEAREKVLTAAASLRYRVNVSARVLRRGIHKLLGVIFPSSASRGVIGHAVMAQKLEGVARGAERLGYDLQIFFMDLNDPDGLGRLAMEKSISAFCFTGHVQPVTLKLLDRYTIPWVGVNWRDPDRPDDPHCWTDFLHAGRTLTQHLYEVGCRRIVAFDWLSPAYGPFGDGISQAWSDLRLARRDMQLHTGRQFACGEALDAELKRVLSHPARPDGLIVSHEDGALSAYRIMRELKLKPGRDVAIATFDDLSSAAYMDPPCTAYAQPTYEMGEAAVEELDRIISAEAGRTSRKISRVIRGELRVRPSTQLFHKSEQG